MEKVKPGFLLSSMCVFPKALIAIYVYASESSRFILLENGIGYYAMTQRFEIYFIKVFYVIEVFQFIEVYFISQYLLNFCSDLYNTCYVLKEYDEVFQMDINKLL